MHLKTSIKAIEYYLPPFVEVGSDLVADNPEWRIKDIESKTGILQRHISTTETSVDMGFFAARKILKKYDNADDIDLLIFVTQSPLYVLPTSACILQDKLGLKTTCMAFDVNLGCSGFVYALAMCSSLIEAGVASQGLIVCSDTYTKYIESNDRTCRPIFSDGAAATLVVSDVFGSIGPFDLGTDGSGFDKLIVKSATKSNNLINSKLHMNGSAVFMFTMNMVPKSINKLLIKEGIMLSDVDAFIFHQASKLVLDNLIRRLELPKNKVFVNYHKVGNTVSASIPIALKQASDEGKLKEGNTIMLSGFGVGLSWGSCLIKFGQKI